MKFSENSMKFQKKNLKGIILAFEKVGLAKTFIFAMKFFNNVGVHLDYKLKINKHKTVNKIRYNFFLGKLFSNCK